MARRLRDAEWAATALGPSEAWPPPLRSAVEILLRIGFPAFLWWAPERIEIRNDAAWQLTGDGNRWPAPAAAHRVLDSGETVCATVAVPTRRGPKLCAVSFSLLGAARPATGVLAIVGHLADTAPPPADPRLTELQSVLSTTLAVLRSIARRSAVPDGPASAYARHLDGRLAAVARVHTALARDPLAGIDLALLLVDTLAASGAREPRDFSLSGPPLALTGKRAEAIGLALHELATNAAKFGALAHRGARIAVRWRVETGVGPAEPRLLIDWDETGVRPRTSPRPPHRGFGTEVLERGLADEFGARVSRRFTGDGLQCRIDLPLSG